MELAGPVAPVPPAEPAFWATWGVEQWGVVIGIIVAIVVPCAIWYHERKDTGRAEERKERVAALRAILVELGEVEKKFEPFSYKVFDYEAAEVKGSAVWTDRLIERCSDPRLALGERPLLTQFAYSIHAAAVVFEGIPTPSSLQFAFESWKGSESSEEICEVVVDMIEKAIAQRADAETLTERCRQLREHVEILIAAAK